MKFLLVEDWVDSGVGDEAGGDNLGLDLLADGLGDLLDDGLTLNNLFHVAPLHRNSSLNLLGAVHAVGGCHLLAWVGDGGHGGGRGMQGMCQGGGNVGELGVGLTLGQQVVGEGGSDWTRAVLGSDVLADALVFDALVLQLLGVTDTVGFRDAVLHLDFLVLNLTVGGEDASGQGGNLVGGNWAGTDQQLGIGAGGSHGGHTEHAGNGDKLEHVANWM